MYFAKNNYLIELLETNLLNIKKNNTHDFGLLAKNVWFVQKMFNSKIVNTSDLSNRKPSGMDNKSR